jgi:hypothetical protein
MPADAPTLHLHIGLPKTATTFLQSGVFPRVAGLRVSCTPAAADGHGSLMEWALSRDPAIWAARGPDLFGAMFGPRAERQGQNTLLSDERIGRAGSRADHLAGHLRAIRAAAHAEGFGRVTCICAVRRQDDWFASHYAQMSDRNPRAGQRDFEASVADLVDPDRGGRKLGRLLHYDRLHARLSEALGEDNLFLFSYETLRGTPDRFARRLGAFLGLGAALDLDVGGEGNVRSAGAQKWALRRYDRRADARNGRALPLRLARAGMARFGSRRSGAIELTPELSARILAAYRPSNLRLAAKDPAADLERHGYL